MYHWTSLPLPLIDNSLYHFCSVGSLTAWKNWKNSIYYLLMGNRLIKSNAFTSCRLALVFGQNIVTKVIFVIILKHDS